MSNGIRQCNCALPRLILFSLDEFNIIMIMRTLFVTPMLLQSANVVRNNSQMSSLN